MRSRENLRRFITAGLRVKRSDTEEREEQMKRERAGIIPE